MVSPLDAKAKEVLDRLTAFESDPGWQSLPNRYGVNRSDLRAILETFTAQAERITEQDLLYKALAELSEHNYRMASNRAEAAEAEVRTLREALTAGVRAANLALFVIRKQGVMPNSSWQAGFEKDMAIASAALRAKEP